MNWSPEKRLELALVVTDEREVREKGRESDKTTAAAVSISFSWELTQPWVVLQEYSLMPWMHRPAG